MRALAIIGFAVLAASGTIGAAQGAAPAAAPEARLEARPDAAAGIGQELPKVLYVVPWKDPEPGDSFMGPRVRLDEDILRPLDRDEFRRRLGLADEAPAAP